MNITNIGQIRQLVIDGKTGCEEKQITLSMMHSGASLGEIDTLLRSACDALRLCFKYCCPFIGLVRYSGLLHVLSG